LVAYPVYNHGGRFGTAARSETRNISRKDAKAAKTQNNNKQFFQDNFIFPPKLGVLCALAGVKSPDRKFHVEQ